MSNTMRRERNFTHSLKYEIDYFIYGKDEKANKEMDYWTIICRQRKWEMRCAIAMLRGYMKAANWANRICRRQ